MGNVNQTVFRLLHNAYGNVDSEDPEATLDLYEELLSGFEDAILEKATKNLIASNEYKSWPVIGELVKECRRLLPVPIVNTFGEDDPDWQPPTEEQKRRCNELLQKAIRHMQPRRDEPMANGARELFRRVSRPEFERMQRESPNQGLHRK
jgi:hypothetical protein